MRRIPELTQLLNAKSMIRCLPPNGTAVDGKQVLLGKWYMRMEAQSYLPSDVNKSGQAAIEFRSSGDGLGILIADPREGRSAQSVEPLELVDSPASMRMVTDATPPQPSFSYAVIGDTLILDPQVSGWKSGPSIFFRTPEGSGANHARRLVDAPPADQSVSEEMMREESIRRLRMLGTGLLLYACQNGGEFPETLGQLYSSGVLVLDRDPIAYFVSPFDDAVAVPETEPEGGWAKWIDANNSFAYLPPGLKGNQIDMLAKKAMLIDLAYAQASDCVLQFYGDGHSLISTYQVADANIKAQTGSGMAALFKHFGREIKPYGTLSKLMHTAQGIDVSVEEVSFETPLPWSGIDMPDLNQAEPKVGDFAPALLRARDHASCTPGQFDGAELSQRQASAA